MGVVALSMGTAAQNVSLVVIFIECIPKLIRLHLLANVVLRSNSEEDPDDLVLPASTGPLVVDVKVAPCFLQEDSPSIVVLKVGLREQQLAGMSDWEVVIQVDFVRLAVDVNVNRHTTTFGDLTWCLTGTEVEQ